MSGMFFETQCTFVLNVTSRPPELPKLYRKWCCYRANTTDSVCSLFTENN